jgi:2,4-dienoyl-CoA reductase-like NADH-dependent reductase (Old Yellow Enzyme family)
MSSEYPHLLSPLQIGTTEVRNRIMQTAHAKMYSQNGQDTQRDVDYQVARAKGGAGLLITGNRLVHPTSTTGNQRFMWAYLKDAVATNQRLTGAVHEHGAKIFEQLNHFGGNATSDSADDIRVLWGPSNVKSPSYGEMPKAMEREDIQELVDWWAHCAELSREGGFDGTEVHIAHSYLLHQFLSPLYNKRTDEYGGSLENRLRLTVEVIDAIRGKVGSDWTVGIRLNLHDFMPGGLDVDDAVAAAQHLQEHCNIDFINVSAAGYHNIHMAMQPSDEPDGYLVEMTARVKAVADIPVFTVGGIKDAAMGDEIVASGKADMVAMTRALIADPNFANKAAAGKTDEIIHCIRGNQGCIGRIYKGFPVSCTVNPATGREGRFAELVPAEDPGHWVVIGGGATGMKAAETLGKRGHRVTLLEASDELGGQLKLVVKTPGRHMWNVVTRDLKVQMALGGVDVRLGTEATPELIAELDPDGVIVATGALPSRTGFSPVQPMVDVLPGTDNGRVFTLWEAIEGAEGIGKRVVLLDDDGSRTAAGAAEVLLDRGHQVHVATRWNQLYPFTAGGLDMATLYQRQFEKGLTYTINTWASAIGDDEVAMWNVYTGAAEPGLPYDSVVVTGQKPNDALYLALKEQRDNVHRAGDAVACRKLDHAIYEGYLAGIELFDPRERYIYEGELEAEAADLVHGD